MNPTQILSLSAIILGIYILFSFFFTNSSTKNFSFLQSSNHHIGCYLSNQNLTQHSRVVLHLEELKAKSWEKSTKISVVPSDVAEKRAVDAARSFENFIAQYNNFKSRSQVNIQLARAVTTANNDFKECIQELNDRTEFSQDQCMKEWETYLNCSTDLTILKNKLNFELTEKEGLMEKMNALLNEKEVQKGEKSHQEDFMKQFRRVDNELEDKERRLEAEHKLLNQKVSQAEYNYTVSKNITANAFSLFSECSEHRIEFRMCEELTEQMLSLGHDSIESLGNKVQRKGSAISKMQKLLNENQGAESSVEFKKVYYEYFEEYKKLMKLFIEAKAKIKKHCGCTQAEELKLKEDAENSRKQERTRLREYQNYLELVKMKTEEINDLKSQRRRLFDEMEHKMKKLSSHQPKNKINRVQVFAQLEKDNSKHEGNIMKLNTQFKGLERDCESIKDRLSIKISTISKIKDCLNKYQYYWQLKVKAEKQAPKEILMSEATRRKLIESVQEFVL